MNFIVVLLFVTAARAAPSESLRYEVDDKTPVLELKSNVDDEAVKEEALINPLEEGKESDSSQRHKKSATTTFCVEVRPSDPYQKPYEICESGNHVYAMPVESGSDYKAPSPAFATSMSSSANRPYSKPVYSAPKPAASFSASNSASAFASSSKTESSYPKGNHYGSYRSGDDSEEEDDEEAGELGIMMDNENEEMMRSAGYGYGNGYDYGHGYGYEGGPYHGGVNPAYGGMSYIKMKGTSGGKKGKGMSHNHGLVITCQPNLAGYASPLASGTYGSPSGGMYGGQYGSSNHMAYRSSSGKFPKNRSKYYGPDTSRPDGYTFGGGKSDSGMSKSPYGVNSLPFNEGAYYNPSGYNKGSPAISTSSSSFSQGPMYPSTGPHIPHRDTSYPPQAPNYPVPSMYGQIPVQPSYNPPSQSYNIPHGAYNNYNHAVPSAPSAYSSPPTSSSASYVPQGAYRSSENTANSPMMLKAPMDMKEKEMERSAAAAASMARHEEKEKHTMDGMNKMTHTRPSGMWNSNMRPSGGQNEMKLEEEMKTEHSNGSSMADNQQTKS